MQDYQIEQIVEKLKNETDPTKHFDLLPKSNEDAQELFAYLIINNNIPLLKIALKIKNPKNGTPVLDPVGDDCYLLTLASNNNHIKIVKLFLSLKDKDGNPLVSSAVDHINTLLRTYLSKGNKEAVKLLLSLKDKDGNLIVKVVETYKQINTLRHKMYSLNTETIALLLAYLPDHERKEEDKFKILETFKISNKHCDILLDNIKTFVDNPKLDNISAESILDFALLLKQKATDQDVDKLLECHKEYDLSLSSYDIIKHVKKQRNTDIDRFKLVCKDFLWFIRDKKPLNAIFPNDIWNIILPFLGGYERLQIEQNLSKLSISPQELSFTQEFFPHRKIRDATKEKLSKALTK